MNCHTVQEHLTRAVDDDQSASLQTSITAHVESCAVCRQFAANLDELPPLIRTEVESISVPSADEMWREVSAQLNAPDKPRKVAPLIWITAPLAAAAALVFTFLPQQNQETDPVIADHSTVQVNYVEVADPDSTAMVYVDKESGWLVVWADDPSATSG